LPILEEETVDLKNKKRNKKIVMNEYESFLKGLFVDLYGTLRIIINNDYKAIANYINSLQTVASPLALYIEGPVDLGDR
jgi:methylaspartate ammonia-lyase